MNTPIQAWMALTVMRLGEMTQEVCAGMMVRAEGHVSKWRAEGKEAVKHDTGKEQPRRRLGTTEGGVSEAKQGK